MAYFGKSRTDGIMLKLEPRSIFLILWVLMCVIVLTLILNNGFNSTQLSATSSSGVSSPSITYVFVPKSPIVPGQRLSEDMFIREERQTQDIHDKVVTNLSDIVGTYASQPISANIPLLKTQISFSIPSNTLATKIPEGFRAITVPVNTESGVEGWVRPGAHVDVVWISQVRSKQVITTLVEDAEVLSAERSTDANNTANGNAVPSHVTLLTNINDAQRIQLAKSSGTISLNLRGATDRNQHGSNTITTDSLLNKDLEAQKLDTVGWIQVGNKAYDVSATGKFNPTNDQKYTGPLFNNASH